MEPYAFKGLDVWQRAMSLTLVIYRLAKQLPAPERFGLASQLRRAAALVPTNIADGSGRERGEFLRYLTRARASLMEVESGVELCFRLDYLEKADLAEVNELIEEVRRMLNSHMQRLSREIPLHHSLSRI